MSMSIAPIIYILLVALLAHVDDVGWQTAKAEFINMFGI